MVNIVQNEAFTNHLNTVYNDDYDNTDYRHFKDMVANHFIVHKVDTKFKCTLGVL